MVSLHKAKGVPRNMVSKKRFAETSRAEMENERDKKVGRWTDVRNFFAPNRLRINEADNTEEEEPNHQSILNNTGKLAGRALKAGFMAGITSPSREWVKITTQDLKSAELGEVKAWLEEITKLMASVFLKSNLYNVLPNVYGDAAFFGTGGMMVLEDLDDVMRFESIPLGTYAIGQDSRGVTNTYSRTYRRTCRQIVEMFLLNKATGEIDWKKASSSLQEAYDNGHHGTYFSLRHVIMPNIDWKPSNPASKKFVSLYYESSTGSGTNFIAETENDIFLRDSGFSYFPFLAFRWDKAGDGVWGNDCPGYDAIGDNMQLQELESDGMQVVASHARPAMQGPSTLENAGPSIVPGDSTWYDVREGNQGFRKVFEQTMEINSLDVKTQQVEKRINEAFYKNLFLAITEIDRGVTATEIIERKQEKLLALGPALERINDDLLDKLIDIAFIMMDRQQMIPPMPEELQGKGLKIEYISILHQAQKSAGLEPIERYTQFVGTIQQMVGSLPKKFDPEGALSEYADRVGVTSKAIRTDDEVDEMVAAENEAIQAQQQREQMESMAKTAKDLGSASMDPSNALGVIAQSAGIGVDE